MIFAQMLEIVALSDLAPVLCAKKFWLPPGRGFCPPPKYPKLNTRQWLNSQVTNPNNQKISNDVENVLGRPAKTFKEYAEDTVITGVWDPQKTINKK